jgi:hypothetical protein
MLVLLLAVAAGLALLLQPNDPASTTSDARSPAGKAVPYPAQPVTRMGVVLAPEAALPWIALRLEAGSLTCAGEDTPQGWSFLGKWAGFLVKSSKSGESVHGLIEAGVLGGQDLILRTDLDSLALDPEGRYVLDLRPYIGLSALSVVDDAGTPLPLMQGVLEPWIGGEALELEDLGPVSPFLFKIPDRGGGDADPQAWSVDVPYLLGSSSTITLRTPGYRSWTLDVDSPVTTVVLAPAASIQVEIPIVVLADDWIIDLELLRATAHGDRSGWVRVNGAPMNGLPIETSTPTASEGFELRSIQIPEWGSYLLRLSLMTRSGSMHIGSHEPLLVHTFTVEDPETMPQVLSPWRDSRPQVQATIDEKVREQSENR